MVYWPHIGFGMFTLQKPDFAIIYAIGKRNQVRKNV